MPRASSSASATPTRWGASAPQKRSATSSFFSPVRARATSPAPISSSMAGSPRSRRSDGRDPFPREACVKTLIPTEPVTLDKCESFAFGLDHAEGIAVTPKGDLYVGGEAGQIYRIENDVPRQVASTGGFLLGLAADADGRIYAIDNVAKKVWRYDPASGALDTFAGAPTASFRVPNWGAFDARGNYYLTDSGDW